MAGLTLARKIKLAGSDVVIRKFAINDSVIHRYYDENFVFVQFLWKMLGLYLLYDFDAAVLNRNNVTKYTDYEFSYFSNKLDELLRDGYASMNLYDRSTYYSNINRVYDSSMPHDDPLRGDDSRRLSPMSFFSLSSAVPTILDDYYDVYAIVLPSGLVVNDFAEPNSILGYITWNNKKYLCAIDLNSIDFGCYLIDINDNSLTKKYVLYNELGDNNYYYIDNNKLMVKEYTPGSLPLINIKIKELIITDISDTSVTVTPHVLSSGFIGGDTKDYFAFVDGYSRIRPVYESYLKNLDDKMAWLAGPYFPEFTITLTLLKYGHTVSIIDYDYFHPYQFKDDFYYVCINIPSRIVQSFPNVFTSLTGLIIIRLDNNRSDILFKTNGSSNCLFDPISNTVIESSFSLVKMTYADLMNNMYNPTTVVTPWNREIYAYYNSWLLYRDNDSMLHRINVQTLQDINTGISMSSGFFLAYQKNDICYFIQREYNYSWKFTVYKIDLTTFTILGPIVLYLDTWDIFYDFSADKFIIAENDKTYELIFDWNTLTFTKNKILNYIFTISNYDDGGIYAIPDNSLAFNGSIDYTISDDFLTSIIQESYVHENYPGFPPSKTALEYIPLYKLTYTGETSDVSDADLLRERFENVEYFQVG